MSVYKTWGAFSPLFWLYASVLLTVFRDTSKSCSRDDADRILSIHLQSLYVCCLNSSGTRVLEQTPKTSNGIFDLGIWLTTIPSKWSSFPKNSFHTSVVILAERDILLNPTVCFVKFQQEEELLNYKVTLFSNPTLRFKIQYFLVSAWIYMDRFVYPDLQRFGRWARGWRYEVDAFWPVILPQSLRPCHLRTFLRVPCAVCISDLIQNMIRSRARILYVQ
jgi:hypothetical protein